LPKRIYEIRRVLGVTQKTAWFILHWIVEPFHLFHYVDEQAFRFNNRKTNDGDRFVMALGSVTGV